MLLKALPNEIKITEQVDGLSEQVDCHVFFRHPNNYFPNYFSFTHQAY